MKKCLSNTKNLFKNLKTDQFSEEKIGNRLLKKLKKSKYDKDSLLLKLTGSAEYTDKAEKLERNDSNINLGIVLKESVKKRVRLRVWAHSIGEYLYILSRGGLTLHHETYGISQQDEDFLE